jgi:diguanylate cyclase (GGDEF)-like protein
MDHLGKAVERARRRPDFVFAALFLDFDRFKVINDSLGHHLGDRLLVEVARRLRNCVRNIDTVARLGGDEFTVLLEDISHPQDTDVVVGRIQEAMARPFDLGGHEVYTSASIGVALNTSGYASADDVLRDADTAMYKAKQSGKARHVVFDPGMHSTAVELLSLETDLRKSIELGELLLNYQPIFSLAGRGLVGFEALVRWRHPHRGMVPPAEFIPLAEETGLILRIGEWVLGEACRQLKEWRDGWDAAHGLYVSVNLSGRQFTQTDLVDQVLRAASLAGLPLRCLKLEVTESLLMENIDTAAVKLEQLRRLGVEISIDDFGTGYSSLSYLHRLPIDTLKVDRSFVTRMSGEDENTEIVRTVIMLAKSLKMKVVAEGVETAGQEALLRSLGCDAGQGYLFSKPLAAEAVEALLPREPVGAAACKQTGVSAPGAGVREICDTYRV